MQPLTLLPLLRSKVLACAEERGWEVVRASSMFASEDLVYNSLPGCLPARAERCRNAGASLLLVHTPTASCSLSTHAHALQHPAACQLMPMHCSWTWRTVITATHQRSILCAGAGRGGAGGRQRTLDAFRSQGASAATSSAGDDDDVDSVPPSQVR